MVRWRESAARLSGAFRRRPSRAGWRRVAVTGGVGVAAALGVLAVSIATAPVPSFDAVRAAARASEATLLDRNGAPLQQLRMDLNERRLDWVSLESVSPALVETVRIAEDRRFWWHPGVDPLAIASAAWDNLASRGARPRGASTISMQVASLATGDRHHGGPRSVGEKLLQMRDALALELAWSKGEIFEAYLNLTSFRGELLGVAAASSGLFAKAPQGLDAVESALLAALLRAPAARAGKVAQRACAILVKTGHGDRCMQAEFAASAMPRRRFSVRHGFDDAPHLARRLLARPGERVRSSLDARLQRFASETLHRHLVELEGRNVEDGAVVVLDNASGEVLAYVGSSGALSDSPQVDGVAAPRQPGSALKPFLYAVAIEEKWLTAASLLDDSPLALTTPTDLYIPPNYDRDFKGPVTVRTALASSLNIPAVRALALVGLERFHERLHALGFASLERDAEHYGYGLALGGAEVNLLTLANAYRALANGGEWGPVRLVPATSNGPAVYRDPDAEARRVLSPGAAYIVTDILADRSARALTFGFASALETRTWSAVKTGTSKAMRDNWAVGFTDRYTVGVWVGNFSGAPMWDVSGVTGAAPVWRSIVEYLHEGQPSRAPSPPRPLERARVAFADGVEPAREEWFLPGTALERVALPPAGVAPRILVPAAGTIVAVDPDIPEAHQAILVHVAAGPRDCLRFDGAPVGRCGDAALRLAMPLPGAHRLELVAAGGAVLDAVAFEVRGIPARPSRAADARADGTRG